MVFCRLAVNYPTIKAAPQERSGTV
jgi:hypothetical protein